MGVVYFSIIPTFEPSRYCKCWIVCFYYRNVVILSEESYNNLMENAHILGTKANYDWLMESKAQLERGQFAKHDLIEVDDE